MKILTSYLNIVTNKSIDFKPFEIETNIKSQTNFSGIQLHNHATISINS